jgi:hypothetical protein
VWTLFIPRFYQEIISIVIFVFCAIAAVWLFFKMVTLAKKAPGTGMPGMGRMVGLPGYQGVKQT